MGNTTAPCIYCAIQAFGCPYLIFLSLQIVIVVKLFPSPYKPRHPFKQAP